MFRKSRGAVVAALFTAAVAASIPQAAYAEDTADCSAGSLKSGDTSDVTFDLDSAEVAQLTLDSEAHDLMMQVVGVDNGACDAAVPNTGHQECKFRPTDSGSYTVRISRMPLPTATVPDGMQGMDGMEHQGEGGQRHYQGRHRGSHRHHFGQDNGWHNAAWQDDNAGDNNNEDGTDNGADLPEAQFNVCSLHVH